MNQSIRCEPFPFPVSEKGAAEGATPFFRPKPNERLDSDFDDLLDSEIESKDVESDEKPEAEPWTLFGVAASVPAAVKVLQEIARSAESLPADDSAEAAPAGAGEQLTIADPLLALETADSPTKAEAAHVERPDQQRQDFLQTLRPAQQNLPSTAPTEAISPEQIAGNPLVPAKMAHGTVAAQAPPMLLASHKQEETAPQQVIPLSAESQESNHFEQPIQFRPISSQRESAPSRDLELAEFSPVDAITPEWSSFEGISDSAEIQPSKSVESVEIAEAIRTHVELLKSSGQGKLDVVLRPDSHTQLHLHVEKVNGEILVQARCDRGDFARLESNWAAVQQSLASQGVRVEALQHSPSFQQEQSWTDSNGSQQQSSSSKEQEPVFFEQNLSSPHRPGNSTASPSPARGWQSWA